jgi:hypothetical protein
MQLLPASLGMMAVSSGEIHLLVEVRMHNPILVQRYTYRVLQTIQMKLILFMCLGRASRFEQC